MGIYDDLNKPVGGKQLFLQGRYYQYQKRRVKAAGKIEAIRSICNLLDVVEEEDKWHLAYQMYRDIAEIAAHQMKRLKDEFESPW